MYHEIPEVEIIKGKYGMNGKVFETHISFLARYFKIVDYKHYKRKRKVFDKVEVIITFDDGFKNNFDTAIPVLEKYAANAIFFISSRHIESDEILWFQYLKLFSFFYTDPDRYVKSLQIAEVSNFNEYRNQLTSLFDQPNSLYSSLTKFPGLETFLTKFQIDDWAKGMTKDNLRQISKRSLFTLGIHTEDHPYLTRCTKNEIFEQIQKNKIFLEELTNTTIDTIAYPIGDYNEVVIEVCKKLGINWGFAVYNNRVEKKDSKYEIPRIGIYTTPLTHLGLKVMGSRLFLSDNYEWIKKIFRN